jgi:perosamine synthetase
VYVPAEPYIRPSMLLGRRVPSGASLFDAFPEERTELYASGRDAFARALEGLEIRPGEHVLLPAYICRSLLPSLRNRGVEVDLYRVDRGLRVDLDSVRDGLKAGASGVVVAHYFGVPGPVEEVAGLCREFGAALIEDAVHLVAPGPLPGLDRHAAVFSFRKWVPAPDGGAVVWAARRASKGTPSPKPATPRDLVRLAYLSVNALEVATGLGLRLLLLRSARMRKRLNRRDEEWVVPGRPRPISSVALRVLGRTDVRTLAATRHRHSARLAAARLGRGTQQFWAPGAMPQVPFVFPVLAEARDAVLARLQWRGINARIYWERLPTPLVDIVGDEAQWVSSRLLCLPVHQALSDAQVERMVDTLETA